MKSHALPTSGAACLPAVHCGVPPEEEAPKEPRSKTSVEPLKKRKRKERSPALVIWARALIQIVPPESSVKELEKERETKTLLVLVAGLRKSLLPSLSRELYDEPGEVMEAMPPLPVTLLQAPLKPEPPFCPAMEPIP